MRRSLALALVAAWSRANGATIAENAAYQACLKNPAGCTQLNLAGQGLSGPIPTTIGDLTYLTDLKANNNTLDGVLPTELGLCISLTKIHLFNNKLGGKLPSELGALPLVDLRLQHNALEGELPADMGQLAELLQLNLAHNSLEGSIPSEWEGLTAVQHLSLAFNRLSGPLPGPVLAGWSQLESLELEWNRLAGALSPQVGQMVHLKELALSHNELTSSLPSELGQLSELRTLLLFMNFFSGSVPSQLGALNLTSCVLTSPPGLVGEETAKKPFNHFHRPAPEGVQQQCELVTAEAFTMPDSVHETCGMCLRHRCSLYGMNKCGAKWGFKDPEGEDKGLCMCACCAEQCMAQHFSCPTSQLLAEAHEARLNDQSRTAPLVAVAALAGLALAVAVALGLVANARRRANPQLATPMS